MLRVKSNNGSSRGSGLIPGNNTVAHNHLSVSPGPVDLLDTTSSRNASGAHMQTGRKFTHIK